MLGEGRIVECSQCHGTGAPYSEKTISVDDCSSCNGWGKYFTITFPSRINGVTEVTVKLVMSKESMAIVDRIFLDYRCKLELIGEGQNNPSESINRFFDLMIQDYVDKTFTN